MSVEIAAVGGFGEVGRNMTAVRVDDEVVIFDMGLHMERYIKLTEEEIGELVKLNEPTLKRAEAVPQDSLIKDWRANVVAIVTSHAHLDHCGAIPYIAAKYDAPIICTPFTAAVLRTICADEKIRLQNKIIELKPGQTIPLSGKLKLEFVNATHSTVQTVIAALHSKEGIVVYANDYKLDEHPIVGKPPDYQRLKQLGQKGVVCLIQDCIYARDHKKTPSERVAREMLHDVLLDMETKGKGIIVTTFASHIARLKSIAEFGRMLKRRVVFMSRSIAKYTFAAKDSGVIDLSKEAEICKFSRQIRKKMLEIQSKGKSKYLLVVSGHQGEPKSVLNKMIDGIYPWKFDPDDHVIFSSAVIPAEINRRNRAEMEAKLLDRQVRLFKDIHVSGHSSREDMRDIIMMLKPKNLIPAHGDIDMMKAFNELGLEMGYVMHKTLHPITNGQRQVL